MIKASNHHISPKIGILNIRVEYGCSYKPQIVGMGLRALQMGVDRKYGTLGLDEISRDQGP